MSRLRLDAEVSTLLKISERTVYAMAKEDRPPGAVKVGGSWRVMRAKLMGWLDAGGDAPPRKDGEGA